MELFKEDSKATIEPPPFLYGVSPGLTSTAAESGDIQLAPPVPANAFQVNDLDHVRPEVTMETQVLRLFQDGSTELPADEGSARRDCRSDDESLHEGKFKVPPPWQGIAIDLPGDDTAFSRQLMHMESQLAYMIEGQERMQAVVGKLYQVCVGMDALLAQRLAGIHGGGSNGNGLQTQRSCTVLPRQKQFLKELSGQPHLPLVGSPTLFLKERSGLRGDCTDVAGEDSPLKSADEQREHGLMCSSGESKKTQRSNRSAANGRRRVSERRHSERGPIRSDGRRSSERGPPSRNHFADKTATESDDMCMLKELFLTAETADEEAERAGRRPSGLGKCRAALMTLDFHAVELMLESTIGVVIVLNAISIGVSMDNDEDSSFWLIIDGCFSLLFFLELLAKVWMNGFWFHFCGARRCWRIFDASLVVIDLIQLFLITVLHDESEGVGSAPSASLFRMFRLGKLVRMLRLLKSSVFNDLLAMLQGLSGGLATLGWAMVLFIAVIYLVALLFREWFGKRDVPNVSESFSSVPQAMFTTFRCSFGDCAAPSGVPIFQHVANEYGAFSGLFYCLFVFVVTIGLFNVISAIFVETTIEAASTLQMQKKKHRLRDYMLWCTNVAKLVRRLMAISDGKEDGIPPREIKLTEALDWVYQLEVPCADIDLLVQDPEAINALNALDIVPEDRDYLSDILDPDSGGTINVIELVEGLRRLRGDPRRSDIVTINLMIRSVQKDVADIVEVIGKIFNSLRGKQLL